MRTVAGGRGRAVVLANGTEGEPASYKDKLLLCHQPHLVADGALLAAAAVGAGRVVIGVEETAAEALGILRRALAERERSEPAGIPVEVVATPPGYVTGEESALVAFVNGGPALPTAAPPRPFERGVGRRPALVANVSNNVGLVPGSLSGAWGYRRELAGQGRRLIRLGLASGLGGLTGGLLLLVLPASAFKAIVPGYPPRSSASPSAGRGWRRSAPRRGPGS